MTQSQAQETPLSSYPHPDDVAGFQQLFQKKRGIFIKFSVSYLTSGRIEESDIFTSAWLTYRMATEHWDPTRGASLISHWINQYRIYLLENYGAPSMCTVPHSNNEEDSPQEPLDDGYGPQNLSLSSSGFSVHDDTGGDGDWTSAISDEAIDTLSDDEFFTMLDFVSTHPVWFHSRYRSVILSISRNGSVFEAASDMERSPSRARQIERRLRHIIAKPHLVRDSRIPLEDPVDDKGHALRYTPTQKLQASSTQVSSKVFNALKKDIHHAQRIITPLVVDQYGRILDGVVRYRVALHYGMATVPTILHPVRHSVTSDLSDPAYLSLRKSLSGKDTKVDQHAPTTHGSLFSF